MTYLNFLICFLVLPILVLLCLTLRDQYAKRKLPLEFQGTSPWLVLFVLIIVAVLYTTPWDNYLVATRVWWYDPSRVLGIIIGWVPIEEYTFFVLQPILAGLWIIFIARRLPSPSPVTNSRPGYYLLIVTGMIWILSLVTLFSGWAPGKYLSIELSWALAPILLQLFVGRVFLLQHRRLVLLGIIPLTLYLSIVDSLAISSAIWTIDPQQSLNILIGNVLPVEEFVFFFLTNTLVVLGLVLGIAKEIRVSIQQSLRSVVSRCFKTLGLYQKRGNLVR